MRILQTSSGTGRGWVSHTLSQACMVPQRRLTANVPDWTGVCGVHTINLFHGSMCAFADVGKSITLKLKF